MQSDNNNRNVYERLHPLFRVRQCSVCNQLKPIEEFPVNRLTKRPFASCEPCRTHKRERARIAQRQITQDKGFSKHGIDRREYARLLKRQLGGCAICQRHFDDQRLCIDHDHRCCRGEASCGRCIRGLLCARCNIAIGNLRDDPSLVQSALNYLSSDMNPHTLTRVPRCALYARVSTEDQTCALQLNELREFVSNRGWHLYAEYVDSGYSGAKDSRPQFDKLLHDARARKFDCVLVWKLDRFGRSVANFVRHMEELINWEVRFVVTSQQIDTDQANPTSRLLMHIFAAFAEFERSMISERVTAGMRAAKKRGAVLGRKRTIFDHDKVRQLKLLGKTYRQISAELGLSIGSIGRVLKSGA